MSRVEPSPGDPGGAADDNQQPTPLSPSSGPLSPPPCPWAALIHPSDPSLRPLPRASLNISLYKAGIIVDPTDFPKIQSRPELLSAYLQLDDLQDCLEGYQAKIDEEEGRHMSPLVALASNQAAYFLGVWFMMGKLNYPGSSEASKSNQKLTRKLGSICGSITWLLWAVALLAHTQGLLDGALGVGFWFYQAYFNGVFAPPYSYNNKDGGMVRLRGRRLYFDRCCIRNETGSLRGRPWSGLDVLNEVCPGVSELQGKQFFPEHFAIQAQNPQRQQAQRLRTSVLKARVIIASKNAYAGETSPALSICSTLSLGRSLTPPPPPSPLCSLRSLRRAD
jgi:hypothetical protein